MTLDQILVFKEITKSGTLRAAAQALRRSQPAVSAALKNLEQDLGFQLLDRSGYRPELTPAGERLLKGVDTFLASYSELLELTDLLKGDCEPLLSVAIDSACPFEIIIPKIQEAVLPFPELELDLKFGVITQSVQSLLNDEVQLAIAPLFTPHQELDSRPLLVQKLIPAIHKRHLAVGKEGFELSELRAIPNIVVSSGQRDSPFGVPGLRGGKSLHVSNHAVKEQLILAGIGWGRVPRERLECQPYADELIPIRRKELPPVSLEIGVLWKREARLGRAAQAVRRKLEELAL